MARVPFISLALVAIAASLTTRIDSVFAAGETLTPAVVKPAPVPPAAVETRVGAAIASDLAHKSKEVTRARTIDLQSAMIEAAEKRIDDKLERLDAGEGRPQRALDRPVRKIAARGPDQAQSEFGDDRLGSLVKMYQAMRPKDAAKIFERLDMGVQVDVASQMRERAMAAIMAEMDPKAASKLTMALAGYAPQADDPAL
jgi:flagellar motility protein MotE (MotC chaperone)